MDKDAPNRARPTPALRVAPDQPGRLFRHAQRQAWQRIRPYSTGGNYVNFQTADDDTARTAEAYGTNYARLQHLKARYDPDKLFRINRNISPRKPIPGPLNA
jgi:hypothetical protein